jgi:hypothetical protein
MEERMCVSVHYVLVQEEGTCRSVDHRIEVIRGVTRNDKAVREVGRSEITHLQERECVGILVGRIGGGPISCLGETLLQENWEAVVRVQQSPWYIYRRQRVRL